MRIATAQPQNAQLLWTDKSVTLVATVTKHGLRWDESAHPRKNDGKFAPKGSGKGAGKGKSHKEPVTDDYEFSVRDELGKPDWKASVYGPQWQQWSFDVGAGDPDESTVHVFYTPARFGSFSPGDEDLGSMLASLLGSDRLSLNNEHVCNYWFERGPLGSKRGTTNATEGGHAREILKHVLGGVKDLMDHREGVITFTGASESHEKLYSSILRLMGRRDPNYVGIAVTVGSDPHQNFALVRKDIFDKVEPVLPNASTGGFDFDEFKDLYRAIEFQVEGILQDGKPGEYYPLHIDLSEWDSNSADAQVQMYYAARHYLTTGHGDEQEIKQFEQLRSEDPKLDLQKPGAKWTAAERRAASDHCTEMADHWKNIQADLLGWEYALDLAGQWATKAYDAAKEGKLERAAKYLEKSVEHGEDAGVDIWGSLQALVENSGLAQEIHVQRYSVRDGWGFPVRYAAKWAEHEHPRAKDGKFVEKGGTSFATRDEIDPDKLSRDVLNRMSKHLKSQGYEVKGGEDARSLMKKGHVFEDGRFTHEDWQAAYDKAAGGKTAADDRKKAKAVSTSHVEWGHLNSLGLTQNWKAAGYLNPDGRFLDFSGSKHGGDPQVRSFDHREAGSVAGMQELMNQGYIRCMPEAGGFDILKPPTPAQRTQLRKVIESLNGEVVLSLENGLGEWRSSSESYDRTSDGKFYHEYEAGTKSSKILADIDRYYAKPEPHFATRPKSPELQRFLADSTVQDPVYHGTSKSFTKYGGGGELSEIGWHYFSDSPKFAEAFSGSDQPLPKHDEPPNIKVQVVGKDGKHSESGWKTTVPGVAITKISGLTDAYSLTHIASGKALGFAQDLDRAHEALQQFSELKIDWSKSGEDLAVDIVKHKAKLQAIARDLRENPSSEQGSNDFGWKPSKVGVGSQMQQVYVRIKKPVDLTSLRARSVSPKQLIEALGKYGIKLTPAELPYSGRDLYQMLNVPSVASSIREQARKGGYDGLKFKDFYDASRRGNTYVVFEAEQIKSATGNQGTYDPKHDDIRFAVRTKPAPQKTVKAYKQFRTLKSQPGKLFPLFIGKDEETPVGKWMDAEHLPTKGYAPRPGWHAGVLPLAPHLRSTKTGTIQEGRVWAEVELPDDQPWQDKANTSKTKDIRDKVPADGHYRFNTSKMNGGAWLIGGSLKINKVLTDDDVQQVLHSSGIESDEIDRELLRNAKPSKAGRTPAKKFSTRDMVPGGRADRVPLSQFDPQWLMLGTMVEMEHTHNVRLAQEIARDHLKENPNYYRLLSRFVEQPTPRPMGGTALHSWREPSFYGQPGQPVKYGGSQPRSPKPHGVTIAGRFYPPGQWIPGGAMQQASAGQRKAVETGDSSHATPEEPDPETAHLGHTPQDILQRLQQQGMLQHANLSFGHGGVLAEVNGQKIVIRVAEKGELARLWKASPAAAAASAEAGGMKNVGSIAGAYRDGQIILAPDFSDGEMNHELIHGLQDLEIISADEVQQFGGHEQMAYAYQRWVDEGREEHGVFSRIADFFRALFGDKVAQQRNTLRRLDEGTFDKPTNWAKVAHKAALLGYAAYQIKQNLPEIKRRRQSVVDMLNQAVYGGAYQPVDATIGRGDVDPEVPESGIREDGRIVTSAVLFATRDWQDWLKNFNEDLQMQAMYTAEDRAELAKGMEATARIFGDFRKLEPEWAIDPHTGKPANPIRVNSDDLFKETFDVTTICPRQDLLNAVIKAVQHKMGTIFGKEARSIINMVIGDLSLTSACNICYGQSSRNNAAQGVKAVTDDIYPKWLELQAKPLGQRIATMRPTTKERANAMKAVFNSDLGHFYWFNPKGKKGPQFSLLFQALERYGTHPEIKALMSKPAVVHDIVMRDYKGKLTPTQAAFMELVTKSIQGGLKPNMPKGWASYDKQLLDDKAAAKVLEYNKSGGFRLNSQSDFRAWHVLEVEQFLTHLKAQQGMAHVYTRMPAFLDIFGGTGIKFNLSLGYAHDIHGNVMKQGGKPVWDMLSYPKAEAMQARRQRPGEVGTMLVATSMDALMTGLDDPEIDMMIPYHSGSVPRSVDKFLGYDDFSRFQHEHWPPGHAKGDRVTTTVNVRGVSKKVTVDWQLPITREHHGDDKEQYLAVCDKLGIVPRFSQLCGRGHLAKIPKPVPGKEPHPLWQVNVDHPNYMKLVRDVASTRAPQRVVEPGKINWQAAEKHAQDWMDKGGSKGEKSIPSKLVQIVVDTLRGKLAAPQSPVGADPLQLPVLQKHKHSARQDRLAKRVRIELNRAIQRVRLQESGV